MERPYLRMLNSSKSMMSVFDLSGTLLLSSQMAFKGIESDSQKLLEDRNILAADNMKARKRIEKELHEQSRHK